MSRRINVTVWDFTSIIYSLFDQDNWMAVYGTLKTFVFQLSPTVFLIISWSSPTVFLIVSWSWTYISGMKHRSWSPSSKIFKTIEKKKKVNVKSRHLYKYSPQKLQLAIGEVQKGSTVLAASKEYGVPRSTLRDKLRTGVSKVSLKYLFQCSLILETFNFHLLLPNWSVLIVLLPRSSE